MEQTTNQPQDNKWEIELGVLCFKAYKNGLWHSELELTKSLKLFISKVRQDAIKEEMERIVKEIQYFPWVSSVELKDDYTSEEAYKIGRNTEREYIIDKLLINTPSDTQNGNTK